MTTFTIRREIHIINDFEFTLPDGYTWSDVEDFSVQDNVLTLQINPLDAAGLLQVEIPLPDVKDSPDSDLFEEDIGIYGSPARYVNDGSPIATYNADLQVANMGDDEDDDYE